MDSAPAVRIDQREVIWAGWEDVAEAQRRKLLPQVREYLARKRAGGAGQAGGRDVPD
jgi:hypothetical protein